MSFENVRRAVPEYPPSLPRTQEELLAWIDFSALNDILAKIQTRSGVEHPRTIDPSMVRIAENVQEEGHVPIGRREIFLGKRAISSKAEVLHALAGLFHEALHVVTLRDDGAEDHSARIRKEQYRTGLADATLWKNKQTEEVVMSHIASTPANEAMTEFLALETLKEYIRRTGNQALMPKDISPDAREVEVGTLAYVKERRALNIVIASLSIRHKLPETLVQNAFTRQYFAGDESNADFMEAVDVALREGERIGDTLQAAIVDRSQYQVAYWHAIDHIAQALKLSQ